MVEESKEDSVMPEKAPQYSLGRYIATGASLGLYFGWFFRPVRPSGSIPRALILSVVITLVMMAVRYIPRRRPAFSTLPLFIVKSLLMYAFVLLVLEARHPAFDMAGRIGAVVLTTVMGALGGLLYSKFGVKSSLEQDDWRLKNETPTT